MAFDPFGWLSKLIPETTLHRTIRYGAAVLCGAFLIHRLSQYALYRNHWLWAMETAVYTVVILAYLIRSDPRSRATGIREIIIPVIATLMPFALLFTPVHPQLWQRPWLVDAIFWIMTAGTGLAVWGLWHLRHSFSITVEARQLVSSGPYRWIRHPVYLGEIIATLAVTILRPGRVNLILLLVFAGLQLWRTRMEEHKLSATLEHYRDYAKKARWFWRFDTDHD